MSEQRDSSPDARVLRLLVRELSTEGAPDLDWDRAERRLLAGLDARASGADDTGATLHLPFSSCPETHADDDEPSSVAAHLERQSATPPLAIVRPRASAAHPLRRVGLAVAALAAVAAALLFFVTREPARPAEVVATKDPLVDPATLPEAPGMAGYRHLSALKSGDVVEAALGPVAFGEPGAVEWTLAAGSRLVVKTAVTDGGAEHVVELDSGSVRGRVHERSDVRFVVTAGETQVVSFSEGAVFTVTRSSKRVVVQMEHGTATVGAKGALGQRIDAPVFAALGLDGVSGFEVLPAEAVARGTVPTAPPKESEEPAPNVDATTPEPRVPAPVRSNATQSTEPSPAPATAAPVVTRVSLGAATSSLLACMNAARAKQRAESSADPGLLVTVSSTLNLSIDADGKVRGVAFKPPLAPTLQNCAVSLFGLTFDAGERTELVPISLK